MFIMEHWIGWENGYQVLTDDCEILFTNKIIILLMKGLFYRFLTYGRYEVILSTWQVWIMESNFPDSLSRRTGQLSHQGFNI